MMLVMLALVIGTVMSVTFLSTQSTSVAISQNVQDHTSARFVAESGLTTAVEYVRSTGDWRNEQAEGVWLPAQEFAGGSFEVMFTDDDGDLRDDATDPVTVTVRGEFEGVTHQVSAVIQTGSTNDAKFEVGNVVLDGLPQAVTLVHTYTSPVVVCTLNYNNNTEPTVVRVGSVGSSSFTAFLQNPSGNPVAAETVSYIVMEEGAWEVNGMKFEAQKYVSTVTSNKNSWVAETQAYLQAYDNPVVIGQVMSTNDADWSVFWCQGSSRSRAPSAAAIRTGKTVCEDTDRDRADEVVGFIVFEEGGVEINDVAIDAHLSSDSIRGMTNNPPFSAPFGNGFDTAPSVMLVDVAGMDGGDGGWAMTYGSTPSTTSSARVVVDEDRIRDNDRAHTTEQVGVLAFEEPMAYPDAELADAQLVALYEFVEVPVVPNLVGHWELDESAGSGGGLAAAGKIHLKNNALVDAYNSTVGAYGGANVIQDAVIATNRTGSKSIELDNNADLYGSAYVGVGGNANSHIDTANNANITGSKDVLTEPLVLPNSITLPGGMPANEGDEVVSGSRTFDSDRQFDKLELSNNATLTIDGNITIVCNDKFLVDNNADVILTPGSSLSIYVDAEVELKNGSQTNADSTRPEDLRIYIMADKKLLIDNNAVLAARVRTVGEVEIKNNAVFYGSLATNDQILMDNNAQVHLDVNMASVTGVKPPLADSARGNDGTYTVGGTLGQGGAIAETGTSVAFDGDDDYAVVPHHDDYLLDAGSLSLWFRTEDRTKTQGIFSKDSSYLDTGGHLTAVIEGGVVRVRLQSTVTTWQWTSSATVQNDTWHHLVFTWGPNKMRMYFDGAEAGDPYDYIGGMGATSGDIGNFEDIVFGANAWSSGDLTNAPLKNFFEGRIDDVRLYDQALDLTQVENLHGGSEAGPSSFPGYIVSDTSGFGEALDMTVQDTDAIAWVDGGGLTFNSATQVLSDAPATKLHTALTESDGLTLQVKFTPANLTQDGPARIVSYSGSSTQRNFTFGQHDDAYRMRLRTTDTGSNGTPDIESANVLDTTEQHVIITADGENVRFYRNGTLELTEVREGEFNWDSAYHLIFGSEADGNDDWLGTLSRVAVYDQALTATQVDNLFNDLPPGSGGSTSGFAVYWSEQP